MALIDASYFVGELNIPNTSKPGVSERLTHFIAKREEELLRSLLGVELHEAYKAGIAVAEPDQKWKDLRDGKVYDGYGIMYKWMGLRVAATKESLIANYVYYWWMRDKTTITTEVGEVDVEADKSTAKSNSKAKQCRAWNEMVKWNRELVKFLDVNRATYPEWDRASCLQDRYNLLKSINVLGI